jgi:transmembrane sensor
VSAAQLEAQAAAWVRKQNFADWSETDQASLDAWLAEAVSHQVAYWRMSAGFDRTERLTALREPMRKGADTPATRKRPAMFLRPAFAAAVALTLVAGIAYETMPREKTYETVVGGHKIVKLTDGSRIELNTDTRLTVETAMNGGRKVRLERGEAYFDIQHNDNVPFIVLAGGHRLTDLGTKFLVRTDADRVRVALMEGAVRLEGMNGKVKQRTTLVPGDIAVATATKLSVAKAETAELKVEQSWRQGLLIFKHTTLADAVAEFNRYNTAKLVISDRAAAQLRIGGTFQSDNPQLFARAAQTMLGLRIEARADKTVLGR